MSREVTAAGYDTSLFKRLQRGGHEFHVLNTQYRLALV
jgi:hypothetical protein